MTPPTHSDQIHDWFANHDYELYLWAAERFGESGALQGGVARDDRDRTAVSTSQLHALENTARMCPPHELLDFLRQRAERREASGKREEAAFWKELSRALRARRDEAVAAALADVDLADAPPRDPARLLAEGLAGRALACHLAAHGRYLAAGGAVDRLHSS